VGLLLLKAAEFGSHKYQHHRTTRKNSKYDYGNNDYSNFPGKHASSPPDKNNL
jgi:hypothetical protein